MNVCREGAQRGTFPLCPAHKPGYRVEICSSHSRSPRGWADHLPSFRAAGQTQKTWVYNRGSPGDEGLAAGGAGGGAGWGGARRGVGEGDGPNGTHFAVAVAGEDLQLPVVEFNPTFHITCYYTAARKEKLLIHTLRENFQILIGYYPWAEANLFPFCLFSRQVNEKRFVQMCRGKVQGCA